MSHLITCPLLAGQLIFNDNPLGQIIAPRYKNKMKATTTQKYRNRQNWRQQIVITNLCKKLTDKQYNLLRRKNAKQIEHHVQKLKSKLRKNIQSNKSNLDVFQNKKSDNQFNLQHILDHIPQKINLQQKYNTKLVNFIDEVQNIKQINRNKQNYFEWYNKQVNNPVKSPNYCRMSFVLEKLSKIKQPLKSQLSGMASFIAQNNAQQKNSKNSKQKIKIKDTNILDNSFLIYKKQQDYVPKYKKIRTLGNQLYLIK